MGGGVWHLGRELHWLAQPLGWSCLALYLLGDVPRGAQLLKQQICKSMAFHDAVCQETL